MRCSNCGSSLSGLPADVIFACRGCSMAWCLENDLISPRELVSFHGAGHAELLLPFWVLEAEVSVVRRVDRSIESSTQLEAPKDFDPLFERGLEVSSVPARKETLFVPAFLSGHALQVGRQLTALAPEPDPGIPADIRMSGGTLPLADAFQLSEGVALAIEAHRPGHLAMALIRIEHLHARVGAMACSPGPTGFHVAGTGVVVPYNTMADADSILEYNGLSRPVG
jgi:hypothetical protein